MKKSMQYILLLLFICLLAGACTKDNFIYTGISNGKHDCSMMEYFKGGSYNWDSLTIMIKHAGLESLFENNELDGKIYDKITFLGPTNHSIRRWMLDTTGRGAVYERVQDIDPALCRTILLRHVIEGKHMREEIARGHAGVSGNAIGTGGEFFDSLGGDRIWLYTYRHDYGDVVQGGAISLYGASFEKKKTISIASTDIEPLNGVVHSLGYDFEFNVEL